ncbi:peptide ABC transporter permease [Sutcliffiella cohnii]|uniref:Peptide ABC transporter permease n=1 Tax=Sutcliffiella cohnii TaxID=33932 RepID=A0A223KMW3_9BACI|nr:ABC transporter permease [Sutcliffiella cohnii]AST90694.1 peptide ABC transporter permease [Sutcliffiella cohnii]
MISPFTLMNKKQKALFFAIFSLLFLGSIIVIGASLNEETVSTNLQAKYVSPTLLHPFGTDWLGRDMFSRTIKGLSLSVTVGVLGAVNSTFIAITLGMIAATLGKTADRIVSWTIDLFLSVPHLVTLILIAFTLGGGTKAIVVGIALTHWPSLARIVRAEVMQIRSAPYVQLSKKMGKSNWWIVTKHIFPHVLPQILVGFLLLFPHAILHEAAVTFIGLGLSPHEPAIGIILSESMKYLSSGMWWLAFFPGLCLLVVVRTFDVLGENVRILLNIEKKEN